MSLQGTIVPGRLRSELCHWGVKLIYEIKSRSKRIMMISTKWYKKAFNYMYQKLYDMNPSYGPYDMDHIRWAIYGSCYMAIMVITIVVKWDSKYGLYEMVHIINWVYSVVHLFKLNKYASWQWFYRQPKKCIFNLRLGRVKNFKYVYLLCWNENGRNWIYR